MFHVCVHSVGRNEQLIDCFHNRYTVSRMPGDGFCGYYALAQCITGTKSSYVDIIQDCIQVFDNVPDLFRLRTTYGGQSQSSLSEYKDFIGESIGQVSGGFAVTEHAWAEEGHFAAIALLYDIAIFVYSCEQRKWFVFNENAGGGYISVVSKPGHFDALDSSNGPPVLPRTAETYGITRQTVSSRSWNDAQRNCAPSFVCKWPEGFSGVHISNKPVVRTSQVRPQYRCDFAGCPFASPNRQAVVMHKIRSHGRHKPFPPPDFQELSSTASSTTEFDTASSPDSVPLRRSSRPSIVGEPRIAGSPSKKVRVHKETAVNEDARRRLFVHDQSSFDTTSTDFLHRIRSVSVTSRTTQNISTDSDTNSVSSTDSVRRSARLAQREDKQRKTTDAAFTAKTVDDPAKQKRTRRAKTHSRDSCVDRSETSDSSTANATGAAAFVSSDNFKRPRVTSTQKQRVMDFISVTSRSNESMSTDSDTHSVSSADSVRRSARLAERANKRQTTQDAASSAKSVADAGKQRRRTRRTTDSRDSSADRSQTSDTSDPNVSRAAPSELSHKFKRPYVTPTQKTAC